MVSSFPRKKLFKNARSLAVKKLGLEYGKKILVSCMNMNNNNKKVNLILFTICIIVYCLFPFVYLPIYLFVLLYFRWSCRKIYQIFNRYMRSKKLVKERSNSGTSSQRSHQISSKRTWQSNIYAMLDDYIKWRKSAIEDVLEASCDEESKANNLPLSLSVARSAWYTWKSRNNTVTTPKKGAKKKLNSKNNKAPKRQNVKVKNSSVLFFCGFCTYSWL